MLICWIVTISLVAVYAALKIVRDSKRNKLLKEQEIELNKIRDKYDEEYKKYMKDQKWDCTFSTFLFHKHSDVDSQYDKIKYRDIPYKFDKTESGEVLKAICICTLAMCIFAHTLSVVIIHHKYLFTQNSYEYMQEYAETVSDDLIRVGGGEKILEYNSTIVENQTLQNMWINKCMYIDDWNTLELLKFNNSIEDN